MSWYVKVDKEWWKYDEKTEINNANIYNIEDVPKYGIDLTNYVFVNEQCFEDLDWSDTVVYNNYSKLGWLDRDGNFYGCDFVFHDLQCYLIHNSRAVELEKKGWVHISKFGDEIIAFYAADYNEGIIPTDAQMKYLSEHPYIDAKMVIEAYANGNRAKARLYEQKQAEKQGMGRE